MKSAGPAGLAVLLERIKAFGLDIQHIELHRSDLHLHCTCTYTCRLNEEAPLHQYFLLDLVNVLLDSIEQVVKLS